MKMEEPPKIAQGQESSVPIDASDTDSIVERSSVGREADQRVEPFLVELCTHLWRAKRRMMDASGEPLPETRRIFRHLLAAWDLLGANGFKVVDHTGQPFDTGQSLRVLSSEQRPEIVRGTVLETVAPTIYYHQQCVQMGEVMVLVPRETLQDPSDRLARE